MLEFLPSIANALNKKGKAPIFSMVNTLREGHGVAATPLLTLRIQLIFVPMFWLDVKAALLQPKQLGYSPQLLFLCISYMYDYT